MSTAAASSAVNLASCLPVVASLLDGGERAAGALFRAVGGERVAAGGAAGLNVNDESDLEQAAALASGEGR